MVSDILEDDIWVRMPKILELLLLDRTTSSNILWANDNYIEHDPVAFAPTAHIEIPLITGKYGTLIKPRALKVAALQKKRTKTKAEVFTPTWIVKKQNDALDENFKKDNLETYLRRKWLEITCGEAPYMATRYDMETGAVIPLPERVGFVDRKLAKISRNPKVTDPIEWQRLAEIAFQASFGFEWNGDSLLLARENLLYTYRDYYVARWGEPPSYLFFNAVANILSYNVFQMDGLTRTIPLSEGQEEVSDEQPFLFDLGEPKKTRLKIIPGIRVKIMDWKNHEMIFFDEVNKE